MIEVCQHRIRVAPINATSAEIEIMELAIQSYGFLLKGHPFATATRYSFEEFASRISEAYDLTTPRNAEIVRVLKSIEQRNPSLH